MRKYLLVIVGIVLALSFSNMFTSCTYHNLDDLSTTCDTTNVTYAAVVQPILQANCYECHSQGNAPAFGGSVDLETFALLSAWTTGGSNSRLLCNIQFSNACNPMPKGGTKMSDCNISKVELWILDGAPNN